MPVGCLIQAPGLFLGLTVILGLIFGYLYYFTNTDLWGIGAPDFAGFTITNSARQVHDKRGYTWDILYEPLPPSHYRGLVRHISPIRLDMVPFLTHDILVTTGDFANSKLVNVSVFDHKYAWYTNNNTYPSGNINLIHATTLNEKAYQTLLQMRAGDQVEITGYEIFRIDAYKPDGSNIGWWQDAGCNTLLIETANIQQQPK